MHAALRRAASSSAALRCGLAVALAVAAAPAPAEAGAGERPRLLVLISVDQLRADYLERGREHWQAGFKRLLDEGAWYRNAAYSYSHTVTCAGHATLATGSQPARHGMVLNEWYERASGRAVRCTEDAALRNQLLGDAQPLSDAGPGDGPSRLLAATLADALRLSQDARIASVSLKARSAIMLAGRRADAIAWLDAASGRWSTSSHYGAPPAFLVAEAGRRTPRADAGRVWQRLLPPERYRHEDDAVGERPPPGWDAHFPHTLAAAEDPALLEQWAASPFSDMALAGLAAAAVRELGLGADAQTDLLAASFSALDLVGHDFGPRSHEVQDLLLHLDLTLGGLLDALDASVGREHYALALSADHGVSPIPEQALALGLDAGRASPASILQQIESALAGVLGPGRRLANATYTDLYMRPGAWDEVRASPEALQALLKVVLAMPGVERVYTREQLAEDGPLLDAIGRRVARSFHPQRSGDLVLVWKPHWIGSSSAATHGSPHAYDRRVPLVLFGAGVRAGHHFEAAAPSDVAPTLAALAGVMLTDSDGRVLAEALVERP